MSYYRVIIGILIATDYTWILESPWGYSPNIRWSDGIISAGAELIHYSGSIAVFDDALYSWCRIREYEYDTCVPVRIVISRKLLGSVSVFGFSFTELNALRCAVAHICAAQLTNVFSNIPRLDEGVYKHRFIMGFHSDKKPRTKSNLEQQKFSIFFLKAITLSVIGGAVPPAA